MSDRTLGGRVPCLAGSYLGRLLLDPLAQRLQVGEAALVLGALGLVLGLHPRRHGEAALLLLLALGRKLLAHFADLRPDVNGQTKSARGRERGGVGVGGWGWGWVGVGVGGGGGSAQRNRRTSTSRCTAASSLSLFMSASASRTWLAVSEMRLSICARSIKCR